MNNLRLLSFFFIFSFISAGVSQNINRDSLLQIMSDTTIESSERQKVAQMILRYHEQLLTPQIDTTIDDSISSIEDEIQYFKGRTDTLTTILYETILSSNKSKQNKKKAIDILINIDDEKSLQFLIKHLGQVSFPLIYFGADNEFDSYYIFTSLHSKTPNNWKLIPIIISTLKDKKNEIEILLLSELLREVLKQDSELYSSIINTYLTKSNGYLKYNLTQMSQNH